MELLHSEIDIEPGSAPQKPNADGKIGRNSAVVRLTNVSGRQNAYLLRLRCDHPYWQDDWCSLHAATPDPGDQKNAPLSGGKHDEHGPNHRFIKVYVPNGGTRDILIVFHLPRRPESRAGRYRFDVLVETFVSEPGGATAPPGSDYSSRGGRYARLPGVAIVRPYHQWNLDVAPEECAAGMVRRGAEFEAVVTNEGNDWLYCDLKLPRSKDLLLVTPTVRLAVPPAEPGADGPSQRTVPLRATTRLRRVRGERATQPLTLSAVRVDAPSVAPRAEANFYGRDETLGASVAGAVVAAETREVAAAPVERALVYCPPVPATLSGLVRVLMDNFRALILLGIGLIVAANLGLLMFENVFRQNIVAEPLSLETDDRGRVVIAGRHLRGARVFVGNEIADVTPGKIEPPDTPFARSVLERIKVATTERDYLTVTLDQVYHNGKPVKLSVQRAGGIPWFGRALPRYDCRTSVVWRDREAEADARAKQQQAEAKKRAAQEKAAQEKEKATEAAKAAAAKKQAQELQAAAAKKAADDKAEAERAASRAKELVTTVIQEMDRLARERDTLSDADKQFARNNVVSKLNDSLTYSQKAVALDPSNAAGWYELASALFYQGKFDEALRRLREARVHCPDDSELKRFENTVRERMR